MRVFCSILYSFLVQVLLINKLLQLIWKSDSVALSRCIMPNVDVSNPFVGKLISMMLTSQA
jgi:hypothetical protein